MKMIRYFGTTPIGHVRDIITNLPKLGLKGETVFNEIERRIYAEKIEETDLVTLGKIFSCSMKIIQHWKTGNVDEIKSAFTAFKQLVGDVKWVRTLEKRVINHKDQFSKDDNMYRAIALIGSKSGWIVKSYKYPSKLLDDSQPKQEEVKIVGTIVPDVRISFAVLPLIVVPDKETEVIINVTGSDGEKVELWWIYGESDHDRRSHTDKSKNGQTRHTIYFNQHCRQFLPLKIIAAKMAKPAMVLTDQMFLVPINLDWSTVPNTLINTFCKAIIDAPHRTTIWQSTDFGNDVVVFLQDQKDSTGPNQLIFGTQKIPDVFKQDTVILAEKFWYAIMPPDFVLGNELVQSQMQSDYQHSQTVMDPLLKVMNAESAQQFLFTTLSCELNHPSLLQSSSTMGDLKASIITTRQPNGRFQYVGFRCKQNGIDVPGKVTFSIGTRFGYTDCRRNKTHTSFTFDTLNTGLKPISEVTAIFYPYSMVTAKPVIVKVQLPIQ